MGVAPKSEPFLTLTENVSINLRQVRDFVFPSSTPIPLHVHRVGEEAGDSLNRPTQLWGPQETRHGGGDGVDPRFECLPPRFLDFFFSRLLPWVSDV